MYKLRIETIPCKEASIHISKDFDDIITTRVALGQFVMILESQDTFCYKILMKQLTSQQNSKGAYFTGKKFVDIDLDSKVGFMNSALWMCLLLHLC